jgi:hypothetical protein
LVPALTEPRLASSVQVSAFIRLASVGGDFATVLRKGDAVAGAILLIGLVRGKNPVLFERFPSLDGSTPWQQLGAQDSENETEITERWQKRAARDPDLWVIELDVASPERLDGLLTAAT